MGLKCGLVGLPNVGKSTLFNALTQSAVPAENFAFCTIDPNFGLVNVPDKRLGEIANLVKPEKIVPNTMEFVDIAGLVEGASAGEGLGNQFLSYIRETDAILHLVRCFSGENINHTLGQVDPVRDAKIINTELVLSDLEVATKSRDKHSRKSNSGDKEARALVTLLENKVIPHLDSDQPLRGLQLPEEELEMIRDYNFLSMKPVIYVLNIVSEGDGENVGVTEMEELAKSENSLVIKVNIKTEAELATLDEQERQEFMQELGIEESALDLLIRSSYKLLGLMTFFTAGEKEVRAWNLRQQSNALAAAGVIHTDFIKHFIRAEVVGYDDYIKSEGEKGAKQNGLWRLEGKEYCPQDGDIIYFRTSA